MQLSRVQSTALMFSLVAIAIGQSLVFAILPPLGREVGLAEIQITSIIAFSAFVFGVVSPYWGRYSDRVGRKRVILIGLSGYTVGTIAFASLFQAALLGILSGMTLYILVLVFRCAQSVIMSASGPAATAYAADHTSPDQRTKAMGKLGAAHSTGTILGPAVSGILATLGLLAPLFFAGILTGLAALYIAFKLPATPKDDLVQRKTQTNMKYTDPRVVRYLAAAIGLFTGFSGVQQTLGFSIQDKMVLSGIETAQMTGAALMVSAIFSFAAQMLLVQRLNWSPETFIRLGLASLLTSTLFIGNFENYFILNIGMAFMGTGLGLAMPSISAAASLAVTADEQGAIAGLVSSSPAIGFITGPVIAGLLYQINPSYPSVFSAVIFLILLITLLSTGRR
jgi:MFS family permease